MSVKEQENNQQKFQLRFFCRVLEAPKDYTATVKVDLLISRRVRELWDCA
jgi:hypothetical protein